MPTLRVTHFSRRPALGAFSLERVFADVRAAMPPDFAVTEVRNKYLSRGILPRLRDAWRARQQEGAVNHVLGDVHYLTYFLTRRRTILTIHDTILVERERGLKRFLIWFFWFWLPLHRCRHVTAISEESRDRLLALVEVDPDRVSVIPNPVSPEFVPKPDGPREGPFRLLHLGTKANKNLSRLCRALDGLEVELTVIGKASATQRALLEVHVPRRRILDGLSDADLRGEYARAEALAFVSTDEGFGLPILEAQATGRPVLTSDRAPMREVAGDAALLVLPEDETAIRAAVERLMTDAAYRAELVERGQVNVERFSAGAIAAHYASLYEIVGRGSRDV